MLNPDSETLFIFPERCSMGVVEGSVTDSLVPMQFSILELDMDQNDSEQFEKIYYSIRKSNAVRITVLPQPHQDIPENESTGSSIIISFHEKQTEVNDWESPLVAAVISINKNKDLNDLKDLDRFNDNIVRLESMGLSIDLGNELSILMLLDLEAIGDAVIDQFPLKIGNFVLSPVYYAEFQPQLKDTIEPLMHALNHFRSSKPTVMGENSINLTGIIPDGRA